MELNPLNYFKKNEEIADEKKLGKLFVFIVVIFILVFAGLLTLRDFVYKSKKSAEPEKTYEITGASEDLVFFSILPGEKVSNSITYQGSIKGGYFFEGNILINILNSNKELIRQGYATAKTDWMTSEEVQFEGQIDFTGFPKGLAFIEIKQDDPSGGESGKPIKFIHIPVIIE